MARLRRSAALVVAIAIVSGVIGCTSILAIDALHEITSGVDASDARIDDVPDAPDDAVDAGIADVFVSEAASGITAVACTAPRSCPTGEGCCVVYGGGDDHCLSKSGDCNDPDAASVFVPCDDPDDCTVLGFPGTVCCGALAFGGFSAVSCKPAGSCHGVHLCDAVRRSCSNGKTCTKGRRAEDVWTCE